MEDQNEDGEIPNKRQGIVLLSAKLYWGCWILDFESMED